jgi:hypothetical protein
MRKAYLFLLLAPSALAYACGGDNGTGDGGTDATTNDVATQDSPSNNDGSTDAGMDVSNDAASDAPKETSVMITCLHPADCIEGGIPDAAYPPDSGEVCCGALTTSGSFPNCSLDGLSTMCSTASACPTAFVPACSTDTVRGCQHASECTEPGYPLCCLFHAGDAGAQFCANSEIAGLTGATCLDAGQ